MTAHTQFEVPKYFAVALFENALQNENWGILLREY